MYCAQHAITKADTAAVIMAETGETLSFSELDQRSNKAAHLLRSLNLKRLDHYAIFMENNIFYPEVCAAGERSGLYYTCINSYLKTDELAYILNNSTSMVVFTSLAKAKELDLALKDCPDIVRCIVVDGEYTGDIFDSYAMATEPFPGTPIADESLGTSMLYSSGTTGRPKGIIRPLPENKPDEQLPIYEFLRNLWQYRENMIYLSPAPLYHSAPQAAVGLTIRCGGTVIIMERFDAAKYLDYISQYKVTHSQLVPTMFSRLLKLPEETRQQADISSLEIAIHAAAPCPVKVKEEMIAWWGPIIHEYYGATEGLGFAACNSEQWLAHKGSVGKVILGEITFLNEDGTPSPPGEPGEIWFKTATEFSYFNNREKTSEATSADGSMTTVGDVGYLDEDGYLYLTDRSTFMIISGGVNIYPQEIEDLLITHPKIDDAAVFGVPNEDFGEEVKAVIQVTGGIEKSESLVLELMDYCAENLSPQKCPRSFDFDDALPRLPTGKLYKRILKDRYWPKSGSKI